MKQGDFYWLQDIVVDPEETYQPQEIGELVTGDVANGVANRQLSYVFGCNDDGIIYTTDILPVREDTQGRMLFLARYESVIAYATIAEFKPGLAERVAKKMPRPVSLASIASEE